MPTLDELMADRQKFDSFIYFSIDDAMAELEKRQSNQALEQYLAKTVKNVPKIMEGKRSVVLFRHIATLNHEIRRFIFLAEALEDYQPVILEYSKDKFTNWNEWKYYLGRLLFAKGYNKDRKNIFESHNIIDFNESNGKPISDVKTKWGQSLVDFHHEVFNLDFPQYTKNIQDLSDWLHEHGKNAKEYYKSFLCLFLRHGILLENFLLETKEKSFTREVILPTFLEILEESGFRPLIVALEPTEIEDQRFWLSHPHKSKQILIDKML